ncbi:MAG TPA: hypothetical protein ENJ88_05615 [Phaeodactylibacter sp.]|nr:hypothetical protein [Phaeodactylibacter sp.]
MQSAINDWKFVLLACLTLGLAPFYPEPHFWGKLRWVAGGAVGMGPIDWFDFVFHGLPWLLLLRLLLVTAYRQFKTAAGK